MNVFCDELSKITTEYFGFCTGSGAEYIVCVSPYKRTKPQDKNTAYIDGYYEISNASYHKTQKFIGFCKSNGCILEVEKEKSYKEFLFENGFFQRGKNTLLQDKTYGSKIYFTVLKVTKTPESGESRLAFVKFLQILKSKQSRFKTSENSCGSCEICLLACPQNAIPNSLDNCLRSHMQEGKIEKSFSCTLENRVLGCEICSEVCPKNFGIEVESQNSFTLANFLTLVEKKDSLLSEKYGKNIIAKNKLIPYILNAMGNSGNAEYTQTLEKYAGSENSNIANSSLIALEKLKRGEK